MHLRVGVDKRQDFAAGGTGTGIADSRNDALLLRNDAAWRAAATSAVRSVDTLSATITSMASACPYVFRATSIESSRRGSNRSSL
jgi:hypothetical protein